MQKIRKEAGVYLENREFLEELRRRERMGQITRAQLLTLRGQALSGDADGAHKGLGRILGGMNERTML